MDRDRHDRHMHTGSTRTRRLAVLVFSISCTGPTHVPAVPANHEESPTSPPPGPRAALPVCGPEVRDAAPCSSPETTCQDSEYDENGVIYCGIQITGYYCSDGTWHSMLAQCDSAGRRRKRRPVPARF